MTHVKAALVQQEVIIFTIGFLVKFKRSFRAPREPWALWLGEAIVGAQQYAYDMSICHNDYGVSLPLI